VCEKERERVGVIVGRHLLEHNEPDCVPAGRKPTWPAKLSLPFNLLDIII